ncbi:hypothetical protein MVEN_00395900 [Mycena venus]|uniref:HIT-type domain-containing protein n=1 Tax=Mycena venus TaxID=2733690 RepID=A0A8H6YVU0_9AGAR|nr:hypothetical protein MVEN_00395900 [Mycena venus]
MTMYESAEASPLNSPADSLVALPDDRPRLRRCRTSSSLSVFSACSSKITLDLPTKTDPSVYLTVRTGTHSAFGAFSPTPDAHSSLQFFATPVRRKRPTVVPPVPERSHTIPSISRTAPSLADRVPPSPSSAPLLDFDTDYATPCRVLGSPAPIHDPTPPTLASVERRSRLCSNRMLCATCRTSGTNFPACARCGAAWCSRACRLPNGVRHVCPAATPQAAAAAAFAPKHGYL